MLDDDPYSLQTNEPIYATTEDSQQPQSLPVVISSSQTSNRSSLYCQPNSVKSLHNLNRPPVPAKPPRKLSERGLPLEHSRSVHQLHQISIRPEVVPIWPAPVRRSNSNCSDQLGWIEPEVMVKSFNNNNNNNNQREVDSMDLNENRNGSLPGQQTLRRFQVHCGDVYAQVDKSRKVSKTSKSSRHTRSKSEHVNALSLDDDEPIYSTIGLSSAQSLSSESGVGASLESSKATKLAEKRKKRASVGLPLQFKSFDLDLKNEPIYNSINTQNPPPPPPLPPAPTHSEALLQIHSIVKQLRHVSSLLVLFLNTFNILTNTYIKYL